MDDSLTTENVSKFLTSDTFCKNIYSIVREKKCSHLDAVILFCSQNEIDLEDVPTLLDRTLKEHLKVDGINEGVLKRESTLPI